MSRLLFVLVGIVIIAGLVGGGWWLGAHGTSSPFNLLRPTTTPTPSGAVVSPTPSPAVISTPLPSQATTTSAVQVESPTSGQKILSPVKISGKAPGSWFFEATFPVKVVDAQGKILGQGTAQAQGDWMTTDMVPFTATITFNSPTTDSGTIVLSKDNPSGNPQTADEASLPISF